jgi:hypothetical protein
VTLSVRRQPMLRYAFGAITLVFIYTTILNVIERPDGVKIASWFIVTSLISRVLRSTELRVQSVEPDATARSFMHEAGAGPIRIIANRPDTGQPEEYGHKLREASDSHHLTAGEQVLFLEVRPGDVSEFSGKLRVEGVTVACCAASARRSRTRSPPCSFIFATRPARFRMPTSAGPRGIRLSTC